MPGCYQPFAYRYVKELCLIQPEDKVKRVIVRKVDALHKWKEFSGGAFCVTWSFVTVFFTFFRFWFFMLNLVDVIIFVRLPQAVKKTVKSSGTGSVIRWETAGDGI